MGYLPRYGLSERKIFAIIKKEKPDLIGVANNFTAQIENVLRVAYLAKQANPKIVTVVGGNHVTVAGREFLENNKDVDICVSGEGEYVFLDLVKNLSANRNLDSVKSIFYRDNFGRVRQNEFGGYIQNLDKLPLPAYHLIDMNEYFNLEKKGLFTRSTDAHRSISLITSRGCPYDCVFCSIHLHMGRRWRTHSADYVANHIDYVVNKYGVKHISFEDDNLTLDLARVKLILKKIIEKGTKITWDTPNGVRADRLDEELAGLMKKSGCVDLIFGIESGDQNVLNKIIKKNLNLETVARSLEICQKFKIPVGTPFVIGFPGEKIENIQRSINFALALKKKYGTRPGFLIATPLIGTELYRICKEKNYLVREPDPVSLSTATLIQGKGLIRTEDFTPKQLKKLALACHRKVTLIDLKNKYKNQLKVIKSLKFLSRHPLKAVSYAKNLALLLVFRKR
jgi:anaerobic magnesium-protoporphyrin IX monomethyl ester cyclase